VSKRSQAAIRRCEASQHASASSGRGPDCAKRTTRLLLPSWLDRRTSPGTWARRRLCCRPTPRRPGVCPVIGALAATRPRRSRAAARRSRTAARRSSMEFRRSRRFASASSSMTDRLRTVPTFWPRVAMWNPAFSSTSSTRSTAGLHLNSGPVSRRERNTAAPSGITIRALTQSANSGGPGRGASAAAAPAGGRRAPRASCSNGIADLPKRGLCLQTSEKPQGTPRASAIGLGVSTASWQTIPP